MWRRQNLLVYENKKEISLEAFECGIFIMKSFQTSTTTRPTIARCPKWIPTLEGLFKLNFDGAIFFDQQNLGIGFIKRWVANLESIEAIAIL